MLAFQEVRIRMPKHPVSGPPYRHLFQGIRTEEYLDTRIVKGRSYNRCKSLEYRLTTNPFRCGILH
jgi:hypothetical protein